MLRLTGVVSLCFLSLVGCNVDAAVNNVSNSAVVANSYYIIMDGSSISFDGNKVQLGQSMVAWKRAIGSQPRCSDERRAPVVCTWDALGLEVGSDDGLKKVKFANLFLRVPDYNSDPLPLLPDGSPAGVSTASASPRYPFAGRLELDGVDITHKKPFREVRASIDQQRYVRCGFRDCSNPHGNFGGGAKIFFELDGRIENDSIVRIGLSVAK